MTVWVVRAGKEGTEESIALRHNVALAGWDEVPDLSAVQSREELRDLCDEAYPDANSGAIRSYVAQLWSFRSEIREGDLVVLPLKTDPEVVAVGRVTSPYRYRPDLPPNAHHTHSVEWLNTRVPRSALGDDILRSINVPPTVSRIGAADAEDRITAVLEGRTDLGAPGGASPIKTALDRQSEEYARSVFTAAYPDGAMRHEVLSALARSIQHAHRVGPRSWSLTLRPDSFTLNVGMVWMMSGHKGRLRMLLDGRSLDDDAREILEASCTLRVEEEVRSLKDPYKVRIEGAILSSLRSQPFYAALQHAHFCAIEEAKSRRSTAVYSKAHSPGLLRYLRAELGEDIPDPGYAVSPGAPPTRNVWLFQANPAKYNLSAALQNVSPGDQDDWYVSRYGDEMRPGDIALLWQGGPRAGLYAIGEITGEIFQRPISSWRDEAVRVDALESAVPFRYTHVLPAPILRETLLQDPTLAEMQIIRAAQGTNFKVRQDEWRKIQELLREREGAAATPEEQYAEPPLEAILQGIQSQGMRVDERTLRRYHVSLKARGFAILSGISGTGKTWLASAYARAVGAECLVVAVAPNWTTNEDLLGYWSPLDHTYHDTEFSRFLREASNEYARALVENRRPRPYHVVLDEMNLARVEYYFAKFLSAMEERAREGVARIVLARDDTVLLAPNLVFTGTVNVDETTHGFADKVYDRAQLVELSAPREALWLHIGDAPYREILMQIWDSVHLVAPFAFRVVDEICTYVEQSQAAGSTWQDALDEQIVQKVLPKLAKTDVRVGEALQACVSIAGTHGLSLTLEKASAMHAGFQEYGFASYF